MKNNNKEVALYWLNELWCKGNIDATFETISPSYIRHSKDFVARGPEEYIKMVKEKREAFPDLTFTCEHIIEEGDMVMLYWEASGMHKGQLMGLEPTGKEAEMYGFDLLRFENHLIVEHWACYNSLDVGFQLGLITIGKNA